MRTGRLFERVAAWSARHARALVVAALVLGALAAVRVLTLEPATSLRTLVDTGSETYDETKGFQREFGADPVYVLVEGRLNQLLYGADLARIVGLEGCISGNVPAGASPPRGVCSELARLKPAKVVYGPGTFINESARVINAGIEVERKRRAAQAHRAYRAAKKLALAQGLGAAEARRLGQRAREVVYAQFVRDALELGARYGIRGLPSISNPEFIDALVFDTKRGAGQPKSRFAYLFPNAESALIQVRLRADLSDAEERRAVQLIRQATQDRAYRLDSGSYLVSGPVVVAEGAGEAVSDSLSTLLLVAVLVMALTLTLIFRVRLRLLPLGLALIAALAAFAGLSLVGVDLTLASVAVLPVLIGLGVDYAVQLQSRRAELAGGEPSASQGGLGGDFVGNEISPQVGGSKVRRKPRFSSDRRAEDLSPPDPSGLTGNSLDSVLDAARLGAPAIALACAATAAGMLALGLSPVAMVRSFGVALVFGTVVAFAVSLTVGSAALSLVGDKARSGRRSSRPAGGRARARGGAAVRRTRAAFARTGTALGRIAVLARLPALPSRIAAGRAKLMAASISHPLRVLAVAAVVGAGGWLAATQTSVESDLTKLLPQDLQAVRDLDALQQATGSSGEIDVVVRARDVTSPTAVDWMTGFEAQALKRHGYATEDRRCDQADLCPAFSLPSLFRSTLDHGKPSAARYRKVLDAVPRYFSQAVVSRDRHTATIAFGVRALPLDEQKRLVDDLRKQIAGRGKPPAGVRAELVGLPVLAADANAELARSRYPMVGLGIAALLAVLLLAYRNVRRALVPLVPIVLATGWSGLAIYLVGIPLNPMSATLGALVIAIATEFSVILADRYRSERRAGKDAAAALATTYATTGKAAVISGTTAVLGFAVLIAADIAMVRDFGIVAVIDLAVALAGVMLVLPAALVLGEKQSPLIYRGGGRRHAGAERA